MTPRRYTAIIQHLRTQRKPTYFIPETIRQCLKQPKIQVGNLKTSRDFTYVEDTADAMTAALETEDIEGETINIGTSKTWKMKDTLNLIKSKQKHKKNKS